MTIIGVDPGYAIVGYGVLTYENNKYGALDYGRIATPADMPFTGRLLMIYEELNALFALRSPDCVAVEQLYFNTNAKTAVSVAQGRGAILLTAAIYGAPVYEYTPLQVKMAVTGYGQADKEQIRRMVTMLLNLHGKPKSDDAADALAVAVCHAHSSGIERAVRESRSNL